MKPASSAVLPPPRPPAVLSGCEARASKCREGAGAPFGEECGFDSGVRAAVAPGARRAVDRLELLEAAAGADGDAGERALRQVDRHLRLVPEALVEPVQESA